MIAKLALLVALAVSQIVQIGTSSISSNGTTVTTPLWAIRIGDTDTPETQNHSWCAIPSLGSNCMDATLWVHEGDGWRKSWYRRPQTADEYVEFVRNVDPKKFHTLEDGVPLPVPLTGLTKEQQATIHFVIQYHGAGMKIYFNSGVSREQVDGVLKDITERN